MNKKEFTMFHLYDLWQGSQVSDIVVTQEQMSAFEKETIAQGISSEKLMQRAGEAAFNIIKERFLSELATSNVLFLVGPGNNGGDGLVIANLFLEAKIKHHVVIISADHYSSDMISQLNSYIESGGKPYVFINPVTVGDHKLQAISKNDFKNCLSMSSLIVDALLGTGQRAAPRGAIAEILNTLDLPEDKAIVSIDLPTGIAGNSGLVFKDAIKAQLTICFQFLKSGMLQYPARQNCGEIVLAPLGIRAVYPEADNMTHYRLLTPANVFWPKRKPDAHKKDFGHVYILGGSRNMPGAAVLSSEAALHSGAGLVTKIHLSSLPQSCSPEIMYHVIDDKNKGYFTHDMSQMILDLTSNTSNSETNSRSVLLIGPGLGDDLETFECLKDIITATKLQLVLDASALNHIAKMQDLTLPKKMVLTPHPGEAARLLNTTSAEIQSDRYLAAREISKKYNDAVVVLKGACTVIYTPSDKLSDEDIQAEQIWISDSANPYLATPGSGDVLAGIIAALLAQGYNTIEAVKLGVLTHALAGQRAYQTKHTFLVASDIILNLKMENRE